MAVDTKPNLSNEKFEQYSGETLNLSGSTEIFGTFTINEQGILLIQSNCGDGKVLTSDADGIATWQELVLSSGENITKEITQSSHGFSVGDVVGWSGGTYNLAIADGTYDGEVVGIVSAVPDAGTFCVTQAGFITGLTGLETSCTYFLSDSTNGLMTTTEPTDDGHISKSVFVAASTSSGWVLPYIGYVLSSGTTVGFINACNGLSDDGVNVCLGGELTENTTINLATYDLKFSGDSIQYSGDYSSTYVDRSLVDKQYVDLAISGATSGITGTITGGTNGLSVSGMNVELGGALTKTTTIDVSGNTLIIQGVDGANLGRFILDNYSVSIDGVNSAVYAYENNLELISAGNSLRIKNNSATYTGSGNTAGIEYFGDYSANYTPRSLVDKAYVTGQTANKLDKSIYQTYTGTTVPNTYVTKSAINTYTGTTAPATFLSKTAFNTYSGTTVPNTYVSKTVYQTYTGTTAPAIFANKAAVNYYTGTTAPATYLPFTMATDMQDPTGFVDGSNINIAYSHTNRTITLTGDLSYYWKGVKKTLTSPWTSAAHSATVGIWYLYSTDGTNFTWSQSVWGFNQIQVAEVYYRATEAATFGVRESHELIDWHAHETLHRTIGTYLISGGQATAGSWTPNTATDTAVSPSFEAATVNDEDLSTTISLWLKTAGYTTMYVSGLTSVYNVAGTHPFTAAGANTYIQINNPLTGTMTAGVHNNYYNVYQILIPVTSDAASQKYRMVFLQPQVAFTSLAAAQAEDTRGLYLGGLALASAEYVIYSRITYFAQNANGNYGKVTIPTNGISYVYGTKMSALSVGGVSATNHANLSNLTWTTSGHLGTNDSFAAFDSSGNACNASRSSMGSFTGSTICATSCLKAPILCATSCVKSPILQSTSVSARTTETAIAYFNTGGCLLSGSSGGFASCCSLSIVGNSTATGFTLTHNLNKQFPVVQVVQSASPYATVYTDVQRVNANCVCVFFDTAPPTGTNYCVIIMG